MEQGIGMVELGSVTHWLSGGTPNRSVEDYWNGDIPWISASTLQTTEVFDSDQHVTAEAVALGSKMAPVNSTLLLVRGSALHNEIRAGLVCSPVCFNQDVKALVPYKCVYPKYLTYFLLGRQNELLRLVSQAGNTAGVLDTKLVQAFNIWLPEYDEQQAIADSLSDVDALLESLEQLITKKRNLKQAAMQELLTGKTRLPGFDGEWGYRSLIEIAEFQKSNFDDGDWVEAEHITDKGIRLIQTGNIGIGDFVEKENRKYIYEQSFIKLHCKELQIGDVLICRLAEPAGRACLFPDIGEGRVITSVDVTIFRPRKEIVDRKFIVQYCSTENWFKAVLDNVGGTTHRRISRGALGKLLIPFPSIDEQSAIATVLSDMDAEITTLEQRRKKTRDLKQAMMQELLTGKTRLI